MQFNASEVYTNIYNNHIVIALALETLAVSKGAMTKIKMAELKVCYNIVIQAKVMNLPFDYGS